MYCKNDYYNNTYIIATQEYTLLNFILIRQFNLDKVLLENI